MEDKRLTRYERSALVMLICAETIVGESAGDLLKRMESHPEWEGTVEKVRAGMKWMVDAALSTLSEDQLHHLSRTARDYELLLKPKLTPRGGNVVMDKETLKKLIDAAQEKCTDCILTEEESRGCALQKIMAILTPMPTYDGYLCVYNNREWEN